MKYILPSLSIVSLLATAAFSGAATVNYSTTTTNNRVVTTSDPLTPVAVGSLVIMGTMTNEADFTTFTEFGRSTIASNAAFPSGVISGGATNNTDTASSFASKSIYIAVYDATTAAAAGHAGLFKSTSSFDSTISSSASAVFSVAITTFTTAIAPTVGWSAGLASVNPAGTTGAAGNPATNRTGIVFDLAPIPEAGSSTLGMLALGLLVSRRKR